MFIKLLIYKIKLKKIPGVPLVLKEENAKVWFWLTHIMLVDSSIGFIQLQCALCWCGMCMGFSFAAQRIYINEDYLLQLTSRSQLEYGKVLFIILVIHSHKSVEAIYSFLCIFKWLCYECCYLFV